MIRTPPSGGPPSEELELARAAEERALADEAEREYESTRDRILAVVADLSRRVDVLEQQMREQAVKPTGEAHGGRKWSKERREQSNPPDPAEVDDARGAVADGLRALTAGHRERDPGDGE